MQRIWIIDCLRGLAVLAMVAYNGAFAFYFLNGLFWPWFWAAFPIAGTFIFLSGVVAGQKLRPFKKYVKRAAKFVLIGLLISATTYIWWPNCFVKFGIIHFFAVASLLTYFFQKNCYNLFLAVNIIGVGILLYPLIAICSLDWFPPLPWFGLYLLGMHWSEWFNITVKMAKLNAISFIGRHSLLIYILHMPLIVAALAIAGLIPNFIF
jgi:uncharacterized membrane protein